MPKKKTHKGTKKVLKVRSSGVITLRKPGSNHNTGKKRTKVNRKNRKGLVLSKSDKKRLKKLI